MLRGIQHVPDERVLLALPVRYELYPPAACRQQQLMAEPRAARGYTQLPAKVG